MKLRERVTFWRESRQQAEMTGAIQPSSRFLARALLRPFVQATGAAAPGIDATEPGIGVVEMGPGTGAVTRAIALRMRPADTLDCYEINEQFAAYLTSRIATDDVFAHVRTRIRIHHAPAQDARLDPPARFVICSLPLNNFAPDRVEAIFDAGRRLVASDGWFSYFEYPLLPRLLRWTSPAPERRRLRDVARIKRVWDRHRDASELVLFNVPPARVVHLRFRSAAD